MHPNAAATEPRCANEAFNIVNGDTFRWRDVWGRLADHFGMQAGTVQLSVPILAALGGSLLLAEPFTSRLALVSVAVLGGVALVLRARAASR